ncbi:MAG: class II fructose-bisphosphate aldolase [Pseudomonadota bacterium]|nr:class II fructose-bisphosphate aldolase [Pseudomonadota bacterium]
MPLVDMRDMLNHAYCNEYAIGGFHLAGLNFLEGIISAAEDCRAPVIVNLAEPHFEHFDSELVITAAERAARRATVPVAIHFDHGVSYESAARAINLGCNGIMVDYSDEAFSDNVSSTKRVVDLARRCGVTVEGELGFVAGVVGDEPPDMDDEAGGNGDTVYTSVAETRAYAERTGVDCLAVSIGTVHGHLRGRTKLDLERLRRINSAVRLPLVIHGGSGLLDDQYRRLVQNGVAKINYYTALSDVAGDSIHLNARADPQCRYTGLVAGIRTRIHEEVKRCMHLWGSAGRAAEVMLQCRVSLPIQHVLICSADQVSDAQVEHVLAKGGEVLADIAGVRRVIANWTQADTPRRRFCWLMDLANEQVIETLHGHPDHLSAAIKRLEHIAGDRISIQFSSLAETSTATEDNVFPFAS